MGIDWISFVDNGWKNDVAGTGLRLDRPEVVGLSREHMSNAIEQRSLCSLLWHFSVRDFIDSDNTESPLSQESLSALVHQALCQSGNPYSLEWMRYIIGALVRLAKSPSRIECGSGLYRWNTTPHNIRRMVSRIRHGGKLEQFENAEGRTLLKKLASIYPWHNNFTSSKWDSKETYHYLSVKDSCFLSRAKRHRLVIPTNVYGILMGGINGCAYQVGGEAKNYLGDCCYRPNKETDVWGGMLRVFFGLQRRLFMIAKETSSAIKDDTFDCYLAAQELTLQMMTTCVRAEKSTEVHADMRYSRQFASMDIFYPKGSHDLESRMTIEQVASTRAYLIEKTKRVEKEVGHKVVPNWLPLTDAQDFGDCWIYQDHPEYKLATNTTEKATA